MKYKTTKKAWQFAATFMIALVLMIPFYSADALAATVQVTRNSGTAGVDGFLNGNGDTWQVEAEIYDTPETNVDPSDVKVKVGSTKIPFASCAEAGTGSFVCSYEDDISSGIPAGEYQFGVEYAYNDANNAPLVATSAINTISSDQDAPLVRNVQVSQERSTGEIVLRFFVSDNIANNPASGLAEIKVINRDTGEELLVIDENNPNFVVGQTELNFNEVLPFTADDGGRVRIQVIAQDRVGNEGKSSPRNLDYDFLAPFIDANSLQLGNNAKFLGTQQITTSLSLNITERNDLTSVTASSDAITFPSAQGDCSLVQGVPDLWECTWQNVQISPVTPLSIEFEAQDQFANTATRTISKTFTKDTNPPQIERFSTQRTFQDVNYVRRSGESRIILEVRDQGSGIDEQDIQLDFGFSQVRRRCETITDGNGVNCYFDVSNPPPGSNQARVSINTFEDRVNNQGEKQVLSATVDSTAPAVESVLVEAISEIGEKDFFQSRDQLKITLRVKEETGLTFLLNVKDIVNDALTLYPEESITEGLGDGWQILTEESAQCDFEEGLWVCVLLTEGIKSGPDAQASFELIVQDTAGNPATSWPSQERVRNVVLSGGSSVPQARTFSFELLGLSEEQDPDYWRDEYDAGLNLMPFIDLDTTEITTTRMAMRVPLLSDNPNAKVVRIDMPDAACRINEESSFTGPDVLRTIVVDGINGVDGDARPQPTMILEFPQFDGVEEFSIGSKGDFEEAVVTYDCDLHIYSAIGSNAVPIPEIETVQVTVPFAFSQLGAVDENIGQLILDIQEGGWYKIQTVASTINKGIQWINYVVRILNVITGLMQLYNVVTGSLKATLDVTREVPPLTAASTILSGTCASLDAGEAGMADQIVGYLQIPTTILACQPGTADRPGGVGVLTQGDNWYEEWQRGVLEAYNQVSLRSALGVPANSLYENVYLSIAGLCLPGIAYNLDKAREIQCRKIICYGREVPAGVATIDACNQLHDLLMCQYFWGPVFDIFLVGGIEQLAKIVQNILSNPVGLIYSAVETLGCIAFCFAPQKDGGAGHTACKVTMAVTEVLDIVETVVGALNTAPSVTTSPYCNQADDIDINSLGPVPLVDEETPDLSDPAAPVGSGGDEE